MKKKKTILIIFLVFLVLSFIYNLSVLIRSGNQRIDVTTNSTYSSGSILTGMLNVQKYKDNGTIPLKANVKIELLDKSKKRVKGVKKFSGKVDKNENLNFSLNIPNTVSTGEYYLKITSKSGILKDVINAPVKIDSSSNTDAIISFDKGIYKPGDEINYRVLLISKNDNTPIKNEVEVSIFDGNENRVYYEKSNTSEYGIISGKFNLADEVNSGTYKLLLKNGSTEFTKPFIVNPYITPKFEVSVTADKDTYLVNENANITVNSKYFFGEPVQNADVVIKVNKNDIQKSNDENVEEIKGITDSNGNFTTSYPVSSEGRIVFSAEVTDSSNYLIEANKTIYAGVDKFNIELLPEYGSLVNGVDNNIYFISKTPDGKPIKTINKISIGNIKRDVITDENGIRTFTLTSGDISNLNSNIFNVVSTDTEGNVVQKNIDINFSNSNIVITTDKTKYNQNDDINIGIIGGTEWTDKNIFICKGNNVIKTISIDEDNTSVNLDDTVGLVDIYLNTTSDNVYNTYSKEMSNKSYIKKTIFIKPSNGLGINIKTDKEEYSPKDKLNIEFNVSNESENPVDSALLVSILDEAVLSLADNDLSIDNIKLALEDIVLSDNITLADIYAEVLDNTSSVKLDTLLLKQSANNIEIKTKVYSGPDKVDYLNRAVLLGFAIFIIVVITVVKLKKIKITSLISALIIILTFTILLSSLIYFIFDYFGLISYKDEGMFSLLTIAASIILTSILYITKLYKYKSNILKHIIILIIVPIICNIILSIIFEFSYSDSSASIYILGILVILSWIILTVASANDGLGKTGKQIKKLLGYIILGVGFWIITEYLIDEFGFISLFCTLIIYILLNVYIFNGKTSKKIVDDGKILIMPETIVSVFALIGVAAIFGIIMLLRSFAGITYNSYDDYSRKNSTIPNIAYDNNDYSSTSSNSGGSLLNSMRSQIDSFETQGNSDSSSSNNRRITFQDVETATSTEDAIDHSGAAGLGHSKDIFDIVAFDSLKNTINDSKSNVDEVVEIAANENIEKETNQVKENVRNVFLESLAFIPEVIAENGNANLSIDISDNITTWNIQVVGNSKDGKIGSGSKTFKVFKEFFVDFSLPTNSVIGDYVEIPVTVYNYTENDMPIQINIVNNDWCKIGEYQNNVNVPAKSTNMIYVPIEIIKNGNQKLRVESKGANNSDVVEKSINIKYSGIEKTEISSVGTIDKDFSTDIIFNEKAIEGSKKIKVKLYPTPASEIINGMENILKMPTGCFEQTSSSLYPDILVLKYLEENKLDNPAIKEKAMNYISKGYQKLLTYEVAGEKGGYSLYGNSPAEPVITAFGLMEFKELSSVYYVDDKVIDNMKEYLYKKQKVNGDFNYSSTYIGGASNTNDYAMNAYIIWALSEADPKDKRLEKSVNYLENNLDKISDNYTLALILNVFANTSNSRTEEIISRLSKNITEINNNSSCITANSVDYYGTGGKYQNVQATALTSFALSKLKKDTKVNQKLINFIINSKDVNGTWGTTQSTVLALRALNEYNNDTKIKEQKIIVNLNGEEKSVEIKEESLDIYEFEFNNIQDENTVKIGMKDGNICYEVIKDYYQEYSEIVPSSEYTVSQVLNSSLNVNDFITQDITITNNSGKTVANGIAKIYIPQGCSVDESSLLQMKYEGIIEKYEYNYSTINIYIRDFANSEFVPLQIKYRTMYPEKVTGALVEFYDYYNPETEGIAVPIQITVNK